MYQLKVWDWDRPGNIVELVRQVNQIRRQHPALQEYDNLRFFRSDDPYLLCYGKRSADGADTTIMVVNLDPYAAHDGLVHVPFWEWGLEHDEPYEVHDLLNGAVWRWQGETNWVRLDPAECPAHIFWVTRLGGEPLVRQVEPAHEAEGPEFPFVSG
jgi:starch synthase (maltosyl-transferring)